MAASAVHPRGVSFRLLQGPGPGLGPAAQPAQGSGHRPGLRQGHALHARSQVRDHGRAAGLLHPVLQDQSRGGRQEFAADTLPGVSALQPCRQSTVLAPLFSSRTRKWPCLLRWLPCRKHIIIHRDLKPAKHHAGRHPHRRLRPQPGAAVRHGQDRRLWAVQVAGPCATPPPPTRAGAACTSCCTQSPVRERACGPSQVEAAAPALRTSCTSRSCRRCLRQNAPDGLNSCVTCCRDSQALQLACPCMGQRQGHCSRDKAQGLWACDAAAGCAMPCHARSQCMAQLVLPVPVQACLCRQM